MTSLLARFGQVEARIASSSSRWAVPRKRRRGEWFCRECQTRMMLQSRRQYSDDALRPPESRLFNPMLGSSENADPVQNGRDEESATEPRAAPWGFRKEARYDGSFWDNVRKDSSATAAEVEVGERDHTPGHAYGLDYQPYELERMAGDPARQKRVDERRQQEMLQGIDLSLLSIDYASVLPKALQSGAPDMVLRCVFAAAHAGDVDFIRDIDGLQLEQIISTVRLADFTTGLLTVHAELSAHRQALMNLGNPLKVVYDISFVLRTIVDIRENAGARTEFPVYKSLLATAADLGSRAWASRLWKDLHRDGHKPDLDCYNLYMASIIGNRKLSPLSRQNKRVLAFSTTARQDRNPGPQFADYSVGPGGLKDKVMTVFGELLKHGLQPNEESFCHVITAAAREGDTAMTRSLIRKAFAVDVDAIMRGETETSPPSSDAGTAPGQLKPSPRFLSTIAHAYGVNSDIPKALHLVDYFSQRYNLEINDSVWSELFEWTFVLAVRRTGRKADTDGSSKGTLPQKSVESLWDTMTRMPYTFRPEMRHYDFLIRNLAQRNNPRPMLRRMRKGWRIARFYREASQAAFARLEEAIESASRPPDAAESPRDVHVEDCKLELLRREWELADIIRQRDRGYLAGWLRLVLGMTDSIARKNSGGHWMLCELPTLLWVWRDYAGRHVEYATHGGIVSFDFYTEEEVKQNKDRGDQRRRHASETLRKVPMLLGEDWAGRRLAQKERTQGPEQGDADFEPEDTFDPRDTL